MVSGGLVLVLGGDLGSCFEMGFLMMMALQCMVVNSFVLLVLEVISIRVRVEISKTYHLRAFLAALENRLTG